MSFKLNHLEIQPDYDAHKNFKISVGKNIDYQTIHGGFPLAQVRNVDPDKVSISFPLARETASTGITLQNQVKELIKNPEIGEVYLNWSGATHLNGHYALDGADIDIPTGGIDGGYAEFSAKLTKIGEKESVQRALQLNVDRRPTSYGTTFINPEALHGFPYSASVFSASGVFHNRRGSLGDVPVVQGATHQDLFTYEQDVGSIGLGDVRVYDDMGDAATRGNWIEIFGPDHKFIGDAVLENTLIQVLTRKTFTADLPGGLTIKYWNRADSDYLVAGTASFEEIGGANYGTMIPKISLNKVSPEEVALAISYPPVANSLKVKASLKRGKWDLVTKPDFTTGVVPGSFVARLSIGTFNSQVTADETVSANTKSDGTYAIATATANHLRAADGVPPYAGITKAGTEAFNDYYEVTSSKVTELNISTGTNVVGFFGVGSADDWSDGASVLGPYLLMNDESLDQVVER